MSRRYFAIVLAVLLPTIAFVVAATREEPVVVQPVFASLGAPTLPFVPKQEFLSATWFCAGVPLEGGGAGGDVVVANPLDMPLTGTITVFTDAVDVEPVIQHFEAPPRDTLLLALEELQPAGSYVSAMIEIAGGGGIVEQRADHSAGSAVSPCSNSTSDVWYFADNYTLNNSEEDLVISNPYPDDAVVNITFAVPDGTRTSQELTGFPVPGGSVVVIPEDPYMPKDEAVLAATVHSSRGRIVVARAQRYLGERQGFSLTLGAPSPSPEWFFADGEQSDDVHFERYSIYNPNDHDVTVTATVLGIPLDEVLVNTRDDVVPAGRVVSFTMAEFADLPDGRHRLEFSTQSTDGVVVERAITRATDEGPITAVTFGAPQVFGGYYRWSMAVGTDLAVDAVLLVANRDFIDGTVTVKALGPGGEVVVPGLDEIVLPASGTLAIAIPQDAAALGVPLVVESTNRIIVERSLPRAAELRGRSASLALPG